jgi:hypothetical protein
VTDEPQPREDVTGYLADLAQRIMERGIDWEKLAAQEAARTGPWGWYCRLCGATGAVDDGTGARDARDKDARAHLAEMPCGRYEITGWAEAGRLLHVWSYPRSAVAQWS